MEDIKMKPIPRRIVRNTDNKRYSLDRSENSEYEIKATRETWTQRYYQIISLSGYFSNKHLYKTKNIVDWLEENKGIDAPVMFIDGKFFYQTVNKQNLYADMAKLANIDWLYEGIKPYYYFQYYEQGSEKVVLLLTRMKKEGINITVKPFTNIKPGEAFGFADGLIPNLMVDMIALVRDNEPEINSILLATANEALIPAIQDIRNQDVKVTLAIAKNQPVSNYFLQQFDDIVEFNDLLDYSGVTVPMNETLKNRNVNFIPFRED